MADSHICIKFVLQLVKKTPEPSMIYCLLSVGLHVHSYTTSVSSKPEHFDRHCSWL